MLEFLFGMAAAESARREEEEREREEREEYEKHWFMINSEGYSF